MKYVNRLLAYLLCAALCLAIFPGTATVSAVTADVPTVTLSEVSAVPDGDAEVLVELSENPGLMAMRFELSYDHTLLTLTGIEDDGLTGWERNEDRVLWLGEADSSFNGSVLKLDFHVSAAAEPGDLEVTVVCGSGDVGNHDEEIFLPKIVPGKIHLHGWNAPTYEWAADNSTVTAQRICSLDAAHVETETVNTASQVTKPAACTEMGETTYTAVFTNPAFETRSATPTR